MPRSVRKSSIAGTNRPGPQKYIPFRADDYQHGKRTGMAVGYIDPGSDDFESFEKVISQADARTPLRPKIQRKKKRGPKTSVIEEEDDDGEMSMDLEDSTPNSPNAYFASARISAITSSVQRVGSSSRPVNHSSDVNFDEIPSPRRNSTSSHSRRRSTPGPSHLSRSNATHDFSDEDFGGFNDVPGPSPSDESDNEPMQTPSRSNRRTSFKQLDMDEDDQEIEQGVEARTPLSVKARGKLRRSDIPPDDDDEDMEDDIAAGFDDIEHGFPDADPDPGLEPEPAEEGEETPRANKSKQREGSETPIKAKPKKKGRVENDGHETKPRKRRNDGILQEVIQDDNIMNEHGVRRGTRKRYAPLEWWRLEKVVYGRPDSGPNLVPHIKEIRRVPKEEPMPLGAKRRSRRGKSRSRTVEPGNDSNPEEGWDDDTNEHGLVWNIEKDVEEEKHVAFRARSFKPQPAKNGEFSFQKMFGEGRYVAAGQITIPPRKTKPTKNAKDNTYVFYVIDGAIRATVHETPYILTKGGSFVVPRGNLYHITNLSDRTAKLFFAQARKVPEGEDENGGLESEVDPASRSPSSKRRSVSASSKRAGSAKK
ncbi:hypothetical protein K474DRAFT_1657637 [Panus rudis PR-1116 ss-1]|nr:hypothetical protein K474DRAFT_1657637 [Panus rudis PR-1116 ss-1]